MKEDTTITQLHQPGAMLHPMAEIAREGTIQMLAAALMEEAASFTDERLPDGSQRVVGHGTGPSRMIQTGIGQIPIKRQKVRDRNAATSPSAVRPSGHDKHFRPEAAGRAMMHPFLKQPFRQDAAGEQITRSRSAVSEQSHGRLHVLLRWWTHPEEAPQGVRDGQMVGWQANYARNGAFRPCGHMLTQHRSLS